MRDQIRTNFVKRPRVHINRNLFQPIDDDQDAEKIVRIVLREFCNPKNQWFQRPQWQLALKAKIAKAVGCRPSDVVLCLD